MKTTTDQPEVSLRFEEQPDQPKAKEEDAPRDDAMEVDEVAKEGEGEKPPADGDSEQKSEGPQEDLPAASDGAGEPAAVENLIADIGALS